MTPTALGVCVCLLALAAVQTAAQECLKAGTAADILDIVKRTRGHALICLDGQGDRYAVCEANNRPRANLHKLHALHHGTWLHVS